MNINDAEKIIGKFGQFFEKPGNRANQFHKESELPFTKTQIRQAMMLDLANQIYSGTYTENDKNLLATSITTLGYFYKDEEAEKLNRAYRLGERGFTKLSSEEKVIFKNAMDESGKAMRVGTSIRMELESFVEKVKNISTQDPIFWQRVYTLCGLPYTPPKKKSLWGLF